MLVGGAYRTEGNKGDKKWDNCSRIINKVNFKNKCQLLNTKEESLQKEIVNNYTTQLNITIPNISNR